MTSLNSTMSTSGFARRVVMGPVVGMLSWALNSYSGVVFDILEHLAPVDPVGSERKSMGFHLIFWQHLIGCSGASGNFSFAGAVDDDLSENRLAPGSVLDDHTVDGIAFFHDVHGQRVKQKLHVVLCTISKTRSPQ